MGIDFMENKPSEYVVITPGVCGGRPRVVGHRLRVQDIVEWHERLGYSPDEIAALYPGLALSSVYGALAYYHDHREAIRQHMRDDQQVTSEARRRTRSKLVERLVAHDADQILS